MKHENILSIEGIAPGLFDLCTVTKWMDNGEVREYLRGHREADRLRLVSLPAWQ